MRRGLSKDLGFSDEDRSENLRRAAEIARMLNDQGYVVILAMVAPDPAARELAKQLVGAERWEAREMGELGWAAQETGEQGSAAREMEARATEAREMAEPGWEVQATVAVATAGSGWGSAAPARAAPVTEAVGWEAPG